MVEKDVSIGVLNASCRPAVLQGWANNAEPFGVALTTSANDLQNKMDAFLRNTAVEYRPSLDQNVPGDIRSHQSKNQEMIDFVRSVADAFLKADGQQPGKTVSPDLRIWTSDDDITARVGSAARDTYWAQFYVQELNEAIAAGDKERVKQALADARGYSKDGQNEDFAALFVLELGKTGIERVLDQVDRQHSVGSGTPTDSDRMSIVEPMAVLFNAATRSGMPEVNDIASKFVADARAEKDVITGDKPRRNLADLIAAGNGNSNFTAVAADTLIGTVAWHGLDGLEVATYANRIALEALDRNDEAAHLFLTTENLPSKWFQFETPREGRLRQMLDPSSLPRNSQEIADRMARVLQSGLADWPERDNGSHLRRVEGDSLNTLEADRAAAAMADIARLAPNCYFGYGTTAIPDTLARITGATWMQDRLVRGAAGGSSLSTYDRDSPSLSAQISSKELIGFYKKLISSGSDDASKALGVGVTRYVQYQIDETIKGGADVDTWQNVQNKKGDMSIDNHYLPELRSAGFSVAALARAHQNIADDDDKTREQVSNWFKDIAGFAGKIPNPIAPFAVPILSHGIADVIKGDKRGSEGAQYATGQLNSILDVIIDSVDNSPQFATLTQRDKEAVAFGLDKTIEINVSDGMILMPS